MIKVEKNIQMAPRNNRYPWDGMKVGDSFVVDKGVNLAHSIAYNRSMRGDEQFQGGKDTEGNARVWRTA